MEVFHDAEDSGAHEESAKEIVENADGFSIHGRSADNTRLQRSTCCHESPDEQGSLTKHRKVCSPDRSELEAWATNQSSKLLQVCRDCMDQSARRRSPKGVAAGRLTAVRPPRPRG
jgi:hypothetical protein